MAILDLFKRARRDDDDFGKLVYQRGAWTGKIAIPQLHPDRLDLKIHATKTADLKPFALLCNRIVANLSHIRDQIAVEAYSTYCIYIEEDLNAGNVTKEELAEYPTVNSAADIWSILTPFCLGFTEPEMEFNWYLALDVRWANTHFFRPAFNDMKLYVLEVDG